MTIVRSLLFALVFYGGTIAIGLLYLPLLLLPDRIGVPFYRFWLQFAAFSSRWIAGIRPRLILATGAALPQTPVIYASKHQSAWETLIFNGLLPNPAFVLKKELKRVPFFGWYMSKTRQVAVDRSAGAAAMRNMVTQAKTAVEDGYSIVIYPQGTRVAPGVTAPYHPGVFALYKALEIPVVPIALNSGHLWARNGFIKRSGVVTVSMLQPIAPGLDRKAFMSVLEDRIETECARLEGGTFRDGRRPCG